MLHKILKYGTVFVVVLCLAITSFSVSAFTGTNVVYKNIPIQVPNSPYIEVLTYYNNAYYSHVIVYDFQFDTSDVVPLLRVSSFNTSSFQVYLDSNVTYTYYSIYYIPSDGRLNYLDSGSLSEDNDYRRTHSFSGSIVGIHYVGFELTSSSVFPSNQVEFVFNYATEGLTFEVLNSIYSVLGDVDESLNDYLPKLDNLDSLSYLVDFDTYFNDLVHNVDSILNDLDSYLPYLQNIDISFESFQEIQNEYLGYMGYLESIYSWLDDNLINYFDSSTSYFSDILGTLGDLYSEFPYIIHKLDLYDDYLLEILDYVSLQEDLINQPPASSSDLSDSIQNNPPREDGKDIVGELDSAQNEALGGKSPEDVKEEIEDTLDSDKLKEEISEEEEIEFEEIELEDITIVNQNVFNIVFDAFGGKWASYVVLSLGLAFACFVIGRRY